MAPLLLNPVPNLISTPQIDELHEIETVLLEKLRSMARQNGAGISMEQVHALWEAQLPPALELAAHLRQIFRDLGEDRLPDQPCGTIFPARRSGPTARRSSRGVAVSRDEEERILCLKCVRTYASLLNYHEIIFYLDECLTGQNRSEPLELQVA